jgi:hypothetical protein
MLGWDTMIRLSQLFGKMYFTNLVMILNLGTGENGNTLPGPNPMIITTPPYYFTYPLQLLQQP